MKSESITPQLSGNMVGESWWPQISEKQWAFQSSPANNVFISLSSAEKIRKCSLKLKILTVTSETTQSTLGEDTRHCQLSHWNTSFPPCHCSSRSVPALIFPLSASDYLRSRPSPRVAGYDLWWLAQRRIKPLVFIQSTSQDGQCSFSLLPERQKAVRWAPW